jgi:basic amino acid/polyamine antiporter, APA family
MRQAGVVPAPEGDDRPGLQRRLGTGDAVVVGLGAMLGAGVFVVLAPAAAAAGPLLLAGLALAAAVAACNALSSASLAAVHPRAGGAYAYGRLRLGEGWGFLAGSCFVTGKTASCAAMALTVGTYVAPGQARAVAAAAVVAVTAVDLGGVRKTARATAVLVALTLATLAVVVGAALLGGTSDPGNLRAGDGAGLRGVLQSAGLLFFAFAGYARITTLGEEVRDPQRTIPRAVPIALALVLAVYAAVALSALLAVGPSALATSAAPLATVVEAGRYAALAPVVRVGAALAALGVLLSLLAGVARTAYAMARDGELPQGLDAVARQSGAPYRADLAVAAVVLALVLTVDVRTAIGFSAFTVLTYYAVANAAALRLGEGERRWPPAVPVAGLAGCLLLAVTLPAGSVVAGVAVITVCWLVRLSARTARRLRA